MKKSEILKALESFGEDDELVVNEIFHKWQLNISKICGKRDDTFGYWCCDKPNHEGDCWSSVKDVDFIPD